MYLGVDRRNYIRTTLVVSRENILDKVKYMWVGLRNYIRVIIGWLVGRTY